MKMLLRTIHPYSLMKLLAFIGALIGLILGILYSFGGLLLDVAVTLDWIENDETPGLSYGTLLAFGALIGMPLIFMGLGMIAGAIGSLSYNLFTRWFEGIEIEVES